MIFSSMFFICAFLPLVLFFYYIADSKYKNYVLLFFSFAFYAWGEPKGFFIMLFVIVLNYFFALLIEMANNSATCCKRKAKENADGKSENCDSFAKMTSILFLVFALVLNFAVLFYFKYFDFAIKVANRVFRQGFALKNIVLPIGISFFIFQSVSYTIDVFRRETPAQKNIFSLALYVAFFPQLIAGPIVKYHEINSQLENRVVSLEDFAQGLRRFIVGLCKKVLIANTLAQAVDEVFIGTNLFLGTRGALIFSIVAYALQIFYDFSGYSDMAIGLGRMFGFRFLENFNYPYISQSITEFWRRWHISLSTWLKEYVYIPLGGNRVSKLRNVFNIFVVFLCTGLWHGAAFNFVVWGLWHGAFNILEKLTGLNKEVKNIFARIFKTTYTILVVLVGWVFFRANSLKEGFIMLQKISGLKKDEGFFGVTHFFNRYALFFFAIGIIFAMPVAPFIKKKICALCGKNAVSESIFYTLYNFVLLVLFVYCLSCLASGTYNPFIYFKF